jgi:integrase
LGFLIGAHALRATAATNALDHQADIAKVQELLGHANIATSASTITAAPCPKTARRSRSRAEGEQEVRAYMIN